MLMCLCYFVIVYPLERVLSFIWINLNPLHPRMFCVKCSWIWPSVSGKDSLIKISSMYLSFIISHWRYGPSFEQIWIPFTYGLSPVWLKLVIGFGECIFCYFIMSPLIKARPFISTNLNSICAMYFFYITIISPSLLKMWSFWLKLTQWFLRRNAFWLFDLYGHALA